MDSAPQSADMRCVRGLPPGLTCRTAPQSAHGAGVGWNNQTTRSKTHRSLGVPPSLAENFDRSEGSFTSRLPHIKQFMRQATDPYAGVPATHYGPAGIDRRACVCFTDGAHQCGAAKSPDWGITRRRAFGAGHFSTNQNARSLRSGWVWPAQSRVALHDTVGSNAKRRGRSCATRIPTMQAINWLQSPSAWADWGLADDAPPTLGPSDHGPMTTSRRHHMSTQDTDLR